jgi:hypothetical protein
MKRKQKTESKKKKSFLEAQLLAILQSSLKKAMEQALNDVLKEWK